MLVLVKDKCDLYTPANIIITDMLHGNRFTIKNNNIIPYGDDNDKLMTLQAAQQQIHATIVNGCTTVSSIKECINCAKHKYHNFFLPKNANRTLPIPPPYATMYTKNNGHDVFLFYQWNKTIYPVIHFLQSYNVQKLEFFIHCGTCEVGWIIIKRLNHSKSIEW